MYQNKQISTKSDYTNWIIPGRLMCGPYPFTDGINFDEITGPQNLRSILEDGINVFVSLCSELPDSRLPYDYGLQHPYFPNYKHYVNFFISNKIDALCVYLPIPDGGTPKISDLISNIQLLMLYLNQGKNIYIHCAGGHGRTNIYTSILFSVLYQVEPETALDAVFKFRKLRRKRDRKLEIYNIPVENDETIVFNSKQRNLVIKICHYFDVKRQV